MEKNNEYTEMGLRAMRRAAKKVYDDAKKNNYKIPIWKNGKVEYIDPAKESISQHTNAEK